ncbi:MAG: flagellar protein FliT [Alcanivorax sp.]|nr:flagellar protein FliT [Alcanivorax sp.]
MTELESRRRALSAEQVLLAYEALLARSGRMLDCVRRHDWDGLMGEEAHYLVDVEQLSSRERDTALDASQQARKADLLERILERDLEIRRCLVARRDELAGLIGTTKRKRDLRRSYGPQEVITMDSAFHLDEDTP